MAEKDINTAGEIEEIIEEKDQKLNIPPKLPILLLRDIERVTLRTAVGSCAVVAGTILLTMNK